MTGPEHYREAERLVAELTDGAADWEPIAALAQVHATLALTAATADPYSSEQRWLEVTT